MDLWSYAVTAAGAYLLGSLPTGFLVGKARGVDIRALGSGNIGATNVFRVLGRRAGLLVLLVDGVKGFAACAWFCDLVAGWGRVPEEQTLWLRLVAGVAVVLGHNFTCWLRFRGGKGIATSAGAYFALAPLAAGVGLAVWLAVLVLSRFVSLASIAAAVVLPPAVWLTKGLTLGLVTTLLGLLAIWRHRANIQRLLRGTEQRLGQQPTAPEAGR